MTQQAAVSRPVRGSERQRVDAATGSLKQQRVRLAAELRDAGRTWVEVAEVFQRRFRLNPRTALRVVRGWSQAHAAEEWNRRWPDYAKTLKNFSYWETWPGQGGYQPSRDNLLRLAELYECGVADLLSDMPSFRHRDSAAATLAVTRGTASSLTGEIMVPSEAENLLLDLLSRHPGAEVGNAPPAVVTSLLGRPEEADFGELAQVIVMWIQRIPHSQTRRDVLGKLTAALVVAAAVPVGDPSAIAEAGVAPVLPRTEPGLFDASTVAHCEAMVPNLRKQGDVLGAHATLPGALAYRQIAEQQAKAAPAAKRERAIAVYAELTQLTGWLCFNMGDYPAAQAFYDDARTAAHEARAVELVTYVLCTMSHLATWQGKPRVGIDHAAAAAAWAEQSDSPHARAYAADVAVRAFTADGQADRSKDALEREYTALQGTAFGQGPRKSWWYFYDESFYWSTNAQNALRFQAPDKVLTAIDRSLTLGDQSNLHEKAFRLLFRAEAFARQRHIGLACQTITDVVALTSVNSTRRIDQRIKVLRAGLGPWRRTRAVRELDQAINSYRTPPPNGSGSTNTS
ncbi:hypothetical protein ACIG87_15150 [Micromonospora sp. NPDC051925]|uniref:hypothetical protein n=1 Tax=Micromonospora sp. NPDC051925 TaxID=3364288 RepID=UPI0037C96C5B